MASRGMGKTDVKNRTAEQRNRLFVDSMYAAGVVSKSEIDSVRTFLESAITVHRFQRELCARAIDGDTESVAVLNAEDHLYISEFTDALIKKLGRQFPLLRPSYEAGTVYVSNGFNPEVVYQKALEGREPTTDLIVAARLALGLSQLVAHSKASVSLLAISRFAKRCHTIRQDGKDTPKLFPNEVQIRKIQAWAREHVGEVVAGVSAPNPHGFAEFLTKEIGVPYYFKPNTMGGGRFIWGTATAPVTEAVDSLRELYALCGQLGGRIEVGVGEKGEARFVHLKNQNDRMAFCDKARAKGYTVETVQSKTSGNVLKMWMAESDEEAPVEEIPAEAQIPLTDAAIPEEAVN